MSLIMCPLPIRAVFAVSFHHYRLRAQNEPTGTHATARLSGVCQLVDDVGCPCAPSIYSTYGKPGLTVQRAFSVFWLYRVRVFDEFMLDCASVIYS